MRHTVSKRPTKRLATPDRPPPSIGHNHPPLEPLVVRPKQAARLLSMSERTIWTHIGQGRLEVSRVGHITLIHMASIRALLRAQSATP